MDHDSRLTPLAAALLPFLLLPSVAAQAACPDFGSQPVAATTLDSPLPLGCSTAPAAPQWRLFTPAHREPTPHVGHAPGNARALPQVIVRYRCTGLLLLPVVPSGIRAWGYVIDQPEYPCGPVSS